MNDVQVVIIALILLVLIDLWSLWRGWQRHEFKLAVKQNINYLRPLVYLVWAVFFIIAGASLTPVVTKWADSLPIRESSPLGIFLIRECMSMVYLITMMWIAFGAISKGFKPLWSYTDKEKESLKASQEKTLKKFPKLLQRLLRS